VAGTREMSRLEKDFSFREKYLFSRIEKDIAYANVRGTKRDPSFRERCLFSRIEKDISCANVTGTREISVFERDFERDASSVL